MKNIGGFIHKNGCGMWGVCMVSIAYSPYGNRPMRTGALAFGGVLGITGGLLVAMSLFSRQTESNPNNQPQSNEQQFSYK